jgi:hypothetical protein
MHTSLYPDYIPVSRAQYSYAPGCEIFNPPNTSRCRQEVVFTGYVVSYQRHPLAQKIQISVHLYRKARASSPGQWVVFMR